MRNASKYRIAIVRLRVVRLQRLHGLRMKASVGLVAVVKEQSAKSGWDLEFRQKHRTLVVNDIAKIKANTMGFIQRDGVVHMFFGSFWFGENKIHQWAMMSLRYGLQRYIEDAWPKKIRLWSQQNQRNNICRGIDYCVKKNRKFSFLLSKCHFTSCEG